MDNTIQLSNIYTITLNNESGEKDYMLDEQFNQKQQYWHAPWFFDRLQMWVWSENNGRTRSRGMLLGSQHFEG